MVKKLLLVFSAVLSVLTINAESTLPVKGSIISPDDPNIQYVGRIDWTEPQRPAFNFPGTEIRTAFEGTSIKMIARPMSGYFMVQIDGNDAFKVSFNAPNDSVVSLATALPHGHHSLRIAYAMEGLETHPEFWGLVLDKGCGTLKPTPLSNRKIEFIGNSITCAYGVESTNPNDHFNYATENHFYGYATIVSDSLNAIHTSISRSGIGVYRNYGGPKEGTADNMPKEFTNTLFGDSTRKWDFERWQPDVVCINLGTNDFSTDNYDATLYENAYMKFINKVRSVYPKAKIVLVSGPMLDDKENNIEKGVLDRLCKECRKKGDKQVFRFDFSHHTGELGYGADWHPSLRQHQKMASELIPFIRQITGWQ